MRFKYNIYKQDGTIYLPGIPLRTSRMASDRAKKYFWDHMEGGAIIEIMKEVEPNHFKPVWWHERVMRDDGSMDWNRTKIQPEVLAAKEKALA